GQGRSGSQNAGLTLEFEIVGNVLNHNHTAILPTIPPACELATGCPSRPNCRNWKNIFPVSASNAALPTTSIKLKHPTRRVVESPEVCVIISRADTAINPWAIPERPQ